LHPILIPVGTDFNQAYYSTGYVAWSADSQYTSGISGYSVPYFRDIFEGEFLNTPTYQAAAAFASMEILVAAIELQAAINASLALDSETINGVIGNNTWSTVYSAEALLFNPTTHLARGEWITTQTDTFLNPSILVTEDDFIYPMPEWDAVERTVNFIFPPSAVLARLRLSFSAEDAVANATHCLPAGSGAGSVVSETCNFRSAVEYCRLEVLRADLSNCSIELPPFAEILLNTTAFGEIEIADATGTLSIVGNGGLIRSSSSSSSSAGGRMLNMFASRADLKRLQPFRVQLKNLTVAGFGGAGTNGGAVRAQHVTSVLVEDAVFQGTTMYLFLYLCVVSFVYICMCMCMYTCVYLCQCMRLCVPVSVFVLQSP
jgi:hypothetical protein